MLRRATFTMIGMMAVAATSMSARTSRPLKLWRLSAGLTVQKALASGLAEYCAGSKFDRSATYCRWKGKAGSLVFQNGRLGEAEIRITDSSVNGAAVVAAAKPILAEIAASAAQPCPVAKPEESSRFATVISQAQWCFADARVVALETNSSFLGRSRDFKVTVSIDLPASAAPPVADESPIEPEISGAIVEEYVALHAETEKQEGVSGAYFIAAPFEGNVWYVNDDVYNRQCTEIAGGRYSCSFLRRNVKTPQGKNIGRNVPEERFERRYDDVVVERAGQGWRSPTFRDLFAAELHAAASPAKAATAQPDYGAYLRANAERRKRCFDEARHNNAIAVCY